MATASAESAEDWRPTAMALVPVAPLSRPIAMVSFADDVTSVPTAMELCPLALVAKLVWPT
jgi:hypothetical protein